MAIMTSDPIDHFHVAIPNSSELIRLSNRVDGISRRLSFSKEANKPPLQENETPRKVKG